MSVYKVYVSSSCKGEGSEHGASVFVSVPTAAAWLVSWFTNPLSFPNFHPCMVPRLIPWRTIHEKMILLLRFEFIPLTSLSGLN